jgi:hypothetical protein
VRNAAQFFLLAAMAATGCGQQAPAAADFRQRAVKINHEAHEEHRELATEQFRHRYRLDFSTSFYFDHRVPVDDQRHQ